MKEGYFAMLQFRIIIHQVEIEPSLWNLNLNNKMSDSYQLTSPSISNNTNSFVYVSLLLRSPDTRYCISGTKYFVIGAI